MLEVNKINVSYGLYQALWEVSIEVGDEETVGLFGPNGHGKTTILKTLSGLLKPTKGEINFNGRRIDSLPPYEIVSMGIVHVPQGRHLFPEMTVWENLMLGAYVPEAWKMRNEQIKAVFEIFPILEERKNQRCSTLSGGEKQMCALGRGIMSHAKLLMLDEPFLGLAPILSMKMKDKIREIKDVTGISMILVDENIKFVAELSDRVYLIENGQTSLEGIPEDIFKSKSVKEAYLGKMWV